MGEWKINWKGKGLESFLWATCSVHLKNIICSSDELFNFYFFPGLLNSLGTAAPNSSQAQHWKHQCSQGTLLLSLSFFSLSRPCVTGQGLWEIIKITGPLQTYNPEETWGMKSGPWERANTFYKTQSKYKILTRNIDSLKMHSVTKLVSNRPKGTCQEFSCKLHLHGYRWCFGWLKFF